MMKNLDLRKIEHTNYSRIEKVDCFRQDNLEQDILRSWDFLQNIFVDIKDDELAVLRVLNTRKSENDEFCEKANEFYISKNTTFEDYRNFILKYKKSDKRIFDIFYNVFKMSKLGMKQLYQEKGAKICACIPNATSTNLLVADFDGITEQEYISIQAEFDKREIETVSIWSGHGVHILIKIGSFENKDILKKWVLTLTDIGLQPDIAIIDAARILRLPYFYNTKAKYEKCAYSEILRNTTKTYNIYDIFSRFGKNFDEIEIEEEVGRVFSKKEVREKIDIVIDEDVDIDSIYNQDLTDLPDGVRNMLKGLIPGYSNLQVMYLTTYLKKFFEYEEIIDIMETLESINGNDWNSWSVKSEVDRFYNKYDAVDKFTFLILSTCFGNLTLNSQNEVLPISLLNYNSDEVKIYLTMLQQNTTTSTVAEISDLTNISKNKIYNNIGELVTKEGKNLKISILEKSNKFILVNKEKLNMILELKSDEIKVLLYIIYRLQKQENIRLKQESIAKDLDLNRKTLSKYLKTLESLNMINIEKGHFYKKDNIHTSNTYSLSI